MTPCTALQCPFCGADLTREGASLYCAGARRHCFDIAKSGYTTLTRSPGTSGDDRAMVKARTEFLDSGAYRPFADAIPALIGDAEVILDAGCGEGYYTHAIASALPNAAVYGFDLSKHACEHAAKRAAAHKLPTRPFFATASIFELPVKDHSADAIVNLFAPVAEREFSRVLKPGGRLIVGAAGKHHLYELKQAIYPEAYENDVRRDLPAGFRLLRQENVTYQFTCGGALLKSLFLMTPYAFRTSPENAAKLDTLGTLDISADFDLFVYTRE